MKLGQDIDLKKHSLCRKAVFFIAGGMLKAVELPPTNDPRHADEAGSASGAMDCLKCVLLLGVSQKLLGTTKIPNL